MLITKYLSSINAEISPFSRRNSKSTRLFLALLIKESARQLNATKVDTKLSPDPSSTKSLLKVTYKDGKVLEINPEAMRITSLVDHINAHSKILALRDQVS